MAELTGKMVLDLVRKRNAGLCSMLRKLGDGLERYRSDAENFRKVAYEFIKDIEDRDVQLDDARALVERINNDCFVLRGAYQDAIKVQSRLSDLLLKKSEDVKRLETAVIEGNLECIRVHGENSALSDGMKQLQKSIDDLSAVYADAVEVQQILVDGIDKRDDKIAVLEIDNAYADAQREKLEQRIARQKATIGEQSEKIASVDDKLSDREADLYDTHEECENLGVELTESYLENERFKDLLKKTHDYYKNAKFRVETFKVTVSQLLRELESQDDIIKSLEAEVDGVNDALLAKNLVFHDAQIKRVPKNIRSDVIASAYKPFVVKGINPVDVVNELAGKTVLANANVLSETNLVELINAVGKKDSFFARLPFVSRFVPVKNGFSVYDVCERVCSLVKSLPFGVDISEIVSVARGFDDKFIPAKQYARAVVSLI